MILASDEKGRRAALAKLLPYQRQDFVELFRIMAGLPVTIRLLDPPLHEFLPHTDAEMAQVASASGLSVETVRRRSLELKESNPMLGHRGCRLAITFPEICEMQARAIFEAAAEVAGGDGTPPVPEVMIPLAATDKEISILKAIIDRVAGEVQAASGVAVEYMVGTMIELPRAALQAGKIAEVAEFFSFGTNDLTQTTYGLSRDDAVVRSALARRASGSHLGAGRHGGHPAVTGARRRVVVICDRRRAPLARLTGPGPPRPGIV